MSDNNTLDELVHEYRTVTDKCMNEHAPKVTMRVEGKHELWYNEKIRQQKRKVRQRERTWRRYVEDHQWQAYTVERNRLNRIIYASKKETLCTKVIECKKHNRKLYIIFV